ncbi:hypothetical protein KSP39_PZI016155 [Platanthera zijinensis]|uniref:Uncharacterized protein n=1 Tax=Platanthera zijinensis TaxID=2320716 RepID=A0AAP0B7V6_9ASPA
MLLEESPFRRAFLFARCAAPCFAALAAGLRMEKELATLGKGVRCCSWNYCGKRLAVGYNDGSAAVHDSDSLSSSSTFSCSSKWTFSPSDQKTNIRAGPWHEEVLLMHVSVLESLLAELKAAPPPKETEGKRLRRYRKSIYDCYFFEEAERNMQFSAKIAITETPKISPEVNIIDTPSSPLPNLKGADTPIDSDITMLNEYLELDKDEVAEDASAVFALVESSGLGASQRAEEVMEVTSGKSEKNETKFRGITVPPFKDDVDDDVKSFFCAVLRAVGTPNAVTTTSEGQREIGRWIFLLAAR